MKSRLATIGAVAACVACCAPLLLPLVWASAAGAAGGGLFFGLKADALVCGAIATAVFAAVVFWTLRRRRAPASACGCASSCTVETCAADRRSSATNPHQTAEQP